MEKPNFKKLCFMYIQQLTNFPYIEEDFDALTNYELLCKVVAHLDNVIKNEQIQNNAILELYDAFNSLKDYVENYFKNLDVQDEINNKLDEMVEDGTLDIIVQRVLNIYDTYNFHTLFATEYYRNSDELHGMQGGCVLPDGTIIQCTGANNATTGKILHYTNDGSLLNSKTVNYGHCNAVTYCDKTESVFITSTQDETIGKYMIYEINPETLEEISQEDLSDKDFPAEPYGLVYIKENEEFVFINYWYSDANKYLWKTDLEFNLISQKSVNVKVRSTSNAGRFGNYIGINTISSNKVMLFNYSTLEFFKEVSIDELVSDTWFITEVEWFDTRNGKIYLGFIPFASTSPLNWGGGTKVVSYFDSAMNYKETGFQNTEFPPSQEIYYVDSSATLNVLRNGSYSAPFRNIYEALNSALRTENVIGDVTINILTDEVNTYAPIFSMNKSYRIYKQFDTPLKCLSAIAINEKAKVFIYGRLILTNGNLINVYNWKDSHIQNRGYFYNDNFITDSENEKLIVSSSSTSSTTFALQDNGMDIERLYGDFYSLYSIPLPDTSFAKITPNTYQDTLFLKRIKNVCLTIPIDSTDNSFQLPLYCSLVFIRLRLRLPNGASSVDREEMLIFKPGQYQDYSFTYYDSSNNRKFIHAIISQQGKLTFAPSANFSDISNLRVICTTY